MVETVFTSPLFVDHILPFLLVFTIIFAVLEKTKILGERRGVNAIVGMVIGLILISFSSPREIVVKLMPVLAVLVVILLVFMIVYGMAVGGEVKLNSVGARAVIVILVLIVLAVSLLTITGYMEKLKDFMSGNRGSAILFNLIFIAIIIGAIISVLKEGKK